MMLQSIRVGKIDGMKLIGILRHISQMQSKSFAQTAELDSALVLQAELESLLCDLLI